MYLPLTPLDPSMDDMVPLSSTHYSPLHSPGVIGHPPLPPHSPHPISSSNLSHTSQPKTPGLNGEFDVAALIAHAARQHEEKKSSGGLTTHSVGVIGDGLTPKRNAAMGNGTITGMDDIWGNPDTSLKRTFSAQGGQLPSSPAPNATVNGRQTFQPFSGSPIVPFPRLGTPVSSTGSRDVVAEVQGHLSALSGLMAPLAGATEEVERLRKEVEMWKAEWGKGERERKRLETVIEEQASSSSGKSGKFSAVLIDGDGLIDSLLQAGFQGGQLAAQTLLSAIPNLSAQAEMSPVAAHAEVKLKADGTAVGSAVAVERDVKEVGSVVVQVFINKSGLGTALVKAGVVPSWSVYDSFWQGFSSAHELFTVIDVGSGKEASDVKIREYLRLYAKNIQCEMIVLGASHDNGYANVLSSLQTESRISKLLLLKGYTDLAYQLRQYSSRVVCIPELFRTTKVPNAPQSFSAIVQATSPPAPRPNTKESIAAKQAKAASLAETIETLEALDLVDTDDSVEVIEWESVSRPKKTTSKDKSAPAKKNKKTASALESSKKVVDDEWHEAGNRKVGKKWKGKGGIAVASVRKLNPRPCHTFYLSPWGCKAGDDCDYSHEYRLTENQAEELTRLAKEIICPHVRNSRCHYSDEECVYGHRCPRGNKCNFGDTCRFNIIDNAHGEDD